MRKRSSYRPRGVMVDPLAIFRPVDRRSARDVMIRVWSALESLADGSASLSEVRDMSDVLNIVETACTNGGRLDHYIASIVNIAIAGLIESAQNPLNGCHKLSGTALESMRTLADFYRQLVEGGLSAHDMAMLETLTNQRVAKLRQERSAQTIQI